MSEQVTKRIEYAYPTSTNADKLGFRYGCYTVETVTGIQPGKAIAGFHTIEEAELWASALPYAWNRFTRRVATQEDPRYILAEQKRQSKHRASEYAQDFERPLS